MISKDGLLGYSLLDDEEDIKERSEDIECRMFIRSFSQNLLTEPKKFCDGVGKTVQAGDAVIYSDADTCPRFGIIIKIDEDGEHCAISYEGFGDKDCRDLRGVIVCNDLLHKCVRINKRKLIDLTSELNNNYEKFKTHII